MRDVLVLAGRYNTSKGLARVQARQALLERCAAGQDRWTLPNTLKSRDAAEVVKAWSAEARLDQRAADARKAARAAAATPAPPPSAVKPEDVDTAIDAPAERVTKPRATTAKPRASDIVDPGRPPRRAGARRRWTAGWNNMDDEGADIVERLKSDPDLLNPRRILAIQEGIYRQIAIPSDAVIEQLARSFQFERAAGPGLKKLSIGQRKELMDLICDEELDPVDYELAERALMQKASIMLANLQEAQRDAYRLTKLDAVFASVMLPFVERYGAIVRGLLDEFIDSPEVRRQAIMKYEHQLRVWLAEAHTAATLAADAV